MACSSCSKKLAHQSLQSVSTGIVYFDSDPQGATIYIDGIILTNPYTGAIERTPSTVPLVEGRRAFQFSMPGYPDVSGYVDVFPNTTVNIYRVMR